MFELIPFDRHTRNMTSFDPFRMLDEMDRGGVSRRDVLLLDTHICISHSNLEDLLLLTACGAVWWILLLARWAMSIVLVWEQRLEFYLTDKRKNH